VTTAEHCSAQIKRRSVHHVEHSAHLLCQEDHSAPRPGRTSIVSNSIYYRPAAAATAAATASNESRVPVVSACPHPSSFLPSACQFVSVRLKCRLTDRRADVQANGLTDGRVLVGYISAINRRDVHRTRRHVLRL